MQEELCVTQQFSSKTVYITKYSYVNYSTYLNEYLCIAYI
jgi:hypothetical protein